MSSHIKRIIIEQYEDGSYYLFNQTDNREICGLSDDKCLLYALLIELRQQLNQPKTEE